MKNPSADIAAERFRDSWFPGNTEILTAVQSQLVTEGKKASYSAGLWGLQLITKVGYNNGINFKLPKQSKGHYFL